MPDDITGPEASARTDIAATSYADWSTDDLWSEFGLVTDEAWDGRDEPEPEKWAVREALGLALIDRGATAADLARGYPLKQD